MPLNRNTKYTILHTMAKYDNTIDRVGFADAAIPKPATTQQTAAPHIPSPVVKL